MASSTESWLMENGTTVEHLPTTTTTTETQTQTQTQTITAFLGRFVGIVNRPMASLHRLWANCHPLGALGDEGVIMPGSALSFIINTLLSVVEIKSQGQAEFLFQTHPVLIMIAVTSLPMYGLASGVQHAISAAHPGPNSVYAVIARWGKNHRALKMWQLTTPPQKPLPCGCLHPSVESLILF